MTTQKLIYDIIIFFFTDIIHFIELLILISVIRGDLSNMFERVHKFIDKVKAKYKQKINEQQTIKESIPKEIQKLKRGL